MKFKDPKFKHENRHEAFILLKLLIYLQSIFSVVEIIIEVYCLPKLYSPQDVARSLNLRKIPLPETTQTSVIFM